MTKGRKFFAYAAIRRGESMQRSFSYGTSLEQIRKTYEEMRVPPSDAKEDKAEEVIETKTEESAAHAPPNLRELMERTVDAVTSQFELTSLTQLMGSAAYIMMLDRHVIDYARQSGEIIEADETTSLVGVSEGVFRKIGSEIERVQRIERGIDALPSALLLSIVATFDSNMADVVRSMLNIKGGSLNFGNKTVPLNEVLQASSIEEFRDRILNEEIYLFSRGSHEEQVQYIEKTFHISIIDHWKRWPDFIEVFERRNLIAHGEKTFTQRYVSICERHKYKGARAVSGKKVRLPSNYLYQALEILLEFSVLLIFSLWRKHAPAEEADAFSAVNVTSFKMISNKQFVVAMRILDYVLGLKNTDAPENIRRMMVVNLAGAHKQLKNEKKCLETLNTMDWSASSENYRICVSALKGDIKEVCNLLPLVYATKSISASQFREWPVFDFIRNDADFAAKFHDVFGENLVSDESIRKVDLKDRGVAVIEEDASPVSEPIAPSALH
ncbi:MAG: hypothetical protein K2X00_18550 [Nitrospiraceae bacterium]|nr:hypothetical protein [Nitrospiraceae bacterium]